MKTNPRDDSKSRMRVPLAEVLRVAHPEVQLSSLLVVQWSNLAAVDFTDPARCTITFSEWLPIPFRRYLVAEISGIARGKLATQSTLDGIKEQAINTLSFWIACGKLVWIGTCFKLTDEALIECIAETDGQ